MEGPIQTLCDSIEATGIPFETVAAFHRLNLYPFTGNSHLSLDADQQQGASCCSSPG